MDTTKLTVPLTDLSITDEGLELFGIRNRSLLSKLGIKKKYYLNYDWKTTKTKPILKLYKRREITADGSSTFPLVLEITISVTNLLKGLNLLELYGVQEEYIEFCDLLSLVLEEIGIKVQTYDNARIIRVDVAKNILLKNVPIETMILLFSKLDAGIRNKSYVRYSNKGSSTTYNLPSNRKPSRSMQIYDKISDLLKFQNHSIGEELQVRKFALETQPDVLRVEVRLYTTKAIKSTLLELDKRRNRFKKSKNEEQTIEDEFFYRNHTHLKDWFKNSLWLDIIGLEWSNIYTNANIGIASGMNSQAIKLSEINAEDLHDEKGNKLTNTKKLVSLLLLLTGKMNIEILKSKVDSIFGKEYYHTHFKPVLSLLGDKIENNSKTDKSNVYKELENISMQLEKWRVINPYLDTEKLYMITGEGGIEEEHPIHNDYEIGEYLSDENGEYWGYDYKEDEEAL